MHQSKRDLLFYLKGGCAFVSLELQKAIQSYEDYIKNHGIDKSVLNAYHNAVFWAKEKENDIEYALEISPRVKKIMNQYVMGVYSRRGRDGDLWALEKACFARKAQDEVLDKYYQVLRFEAQNKILDSYLLYLEKNRIPRERFYAPKRKQFAKFGLIDAYQGAINDEYDIVCISMIPGSGKTTLLKFFNSAIIGWFPNDYNLFYSHSGDITRMYYDGVYQMVTDSQEYTWNEIFPDLQVTSTNAKMQQLNIGKYKPFPSLQTASVGSENAGKVRASKFLLVDDMIGKLEEALNKNILEKQWGAYTVDARQRKTMDFDGNPCKEIINATRWSTGDVIGRVIKMYQGNSRVKVISMPDIDPVTHESNFDYEFGGFTVAFFNDQALLMDEVSYKCLYKQQPVEREGLLFPDDKVQRYEKLPDGDPDEILGQCDTKGKGTDYFVLPCLYRYGETYYCVDAICDNTADYEKQYENSANLIVHHRMNNCEFESNAGGDRVAEEVQKRVGEKGWICNITSEPTESNKEARIYQCSNWILQHIKFKDKSNYSPKSQYGVMMSLLLSYSVSAAKQLDDVPDVLSNFALRMKYKNSRRQTIIMPSPIWNGG